MKGKGILCVLLFIGLTAAKLSYPEHVRDLRLRLEGLLTRNEDYAPLVEAMGRNLADTGLAWELIEALERPPETEALAPGETEAEAAVPGAAEEGPAAAGAVPEEGESAAEGQAEGGGSSWEPENDL